MKKRGPSESLTGSEMEALRADLVAGKLADRALAFRYNITPRTLRRVKVRMGLAVDQPPRRSTEAFHHKLEVRQHGPAVAPATGSASGFIRPIDPARLMGRRA